MCECLLSPRKQRIDVERVNSQCICRSTENLSGVIRESFRVTQRSFKLSHQIMDEPTNPADPVRKPSSLHVLARQISAPTILLPPEIRSPRASRKRQHHLQAVEPGPGYE